MTKVINTLLFNPSFFLFVFCNCKVLLLNCTKMIQVNDISFKSQRTIRGAKKKYKLY